MLQNQIREHVIAIEGEGQAARGFWKARGSGRPWRGGVCARVCACVCTHAAARRREHCGASCPARPASQPGKMGCQRSFDNGQWSLSCEKVARCCYVRGGPQAPSGPSRRLGAAAWDGATGSLTGYQARPECLSWTLKMCFEKRCCWGCCSGQLIQLLHGWLPPPPPVRGYRGGGTCRKPMGPRQYHAPVLIGLALYKRWPFCTKILRQIITLLGRQDTLILSC